MRHTLQIALIGYGKMGHMIHEAALARGHSVPVIIDPSSSEATNSRISARAIAKVDVCIDFSKGTDVAHHAEMVAKAGKALVIGTTGWEDSLEAVKDTVTQYKSGVVYGANFSIGVHLFYAIVQAAADIMRDYPQYDVMGVEFHHRNKLDSPSGTARHLAEILLKSLPYKQLAVYDRVERALAPQELHFSSVRGGSEPGKHTIVFDSTCDTIELKHSARSRTGFAEGAVLAAEWIAHRKGFYSVEDFIADTIPGPRSPS